jgi:hypothetical protein
MAVNPWCTVNSLLCRRVIALCALFLTLPVAAQAQTGSIFLSNATPLVGAPVTFTVNVTVPIGFPPATTLNFGDGSALAGFLPPYPGMVTHAYVNSGKYTVTLRDDIGVLSTRVVTVLVATPRVPEGAIFSTLPVASSVLAGDDTNIFITYRVVTPPASTFVSNAPSLQAIVDLLDAHGNLISRGDPVLIPYSDFAGGGIETAQIPYTVPSDTRGQYQVRVYLRTGEIGGMVARGQPAPLMVIGGPDPQTVVTSEVHASGSIEAGPRIGVGEAAGSLPNNSSSGNVNANIKLGVADPAFTLTGATTLNPTSRRIDPLLTLVPGAGNFDSPNSQQQVPTSASGSPPLHYQHIVGPSTAPLPNLLFSGGETLRGLNSQINQSGWTYQAAVGFPQLASSTSGMQTGYLLDVAKALSPGQSFHATYVENIDDPNTFVPTNGGPPLITQAGGLQFDQPIGTHLKVRVGDAMSGVKPETGSVSFPNGGADKAQLSYAAGATSVDAEYHNFAAAFATGNGLGATSDSAGGSVVASLGLSQTSSLSLNYIHDYTRSAPSSNSIENATFTLSPRGGLQFTLGGTQQHTLTTTADTTNKQFNFSLGSAVGTSTFSLAGNLAAVSDARTSANAGVTRTGQVQYTIARGPKNVSISLNATGNQISTPTSTFAESLVVSFPLGARSSGPSGAPTGARAFGTRGFEVQLSALNANMKAASVFAGSSRDLNLGAVLAYHLGPHVALGLHALTGHHTDLVIPANSSTNSSLRVRMDVQI